MKKYIKDSSNYENCAVIQHGPNVRYLVYYNEVTMSFLTSGYDLIDNRDVEFQMSKIDPYVEADYVWAKKGSGAKISFIQNGKSIDYMTAFTYESDMYESFDEYVNDLFDAVVLELEDYNKQIKGYVAHN